MVIIKVFLVLFLLFSENKSLSSNPSDVMKVYHVDCGRKYFTYDQLKDIVEIMEKNDYNYMELAIANEGLRVLLDDMTLVIGSKIYYSQDVIQAIKEGNRKYAKFEVNELTQAELDTLLVHASLRHIKLIPLINTPGHMYSILYACTKLTGTDCSYEGSQNTIDVSNQVAVDFTLAVIQKYIHFFMRKFTPYFNIGADEYAVDVFSTGSKGFGHLIQNGKYKYFINYINTLAERLIKAELPPMAFNDGFYFNNVMTEGTINPSFLVSYWTDPIGEYKVMQATDLQKNGFSILNTNKNWDYILNWEEVSKGEKSINTTINGIINHHYYDVPGSGILRDVKGCMVCFWCDEPLYEYDEKEQKNIKTQIQTMAKYNPEIFNVTDMDY